MLHDNSILENVRIHIQNMNIDPFLMHSYKS